jgi:K+-transporting ATPase c subunit
MFATHSLAESIDMEISAQPAPNLGKGESICHNGDAFYKNISYNFSDDGCFCFRHPSIGNHTAVNSKSNKCPSKPYHLAEIQSMIDAFLVFNHSNNVSKTPTVIVAESACGLAPHFESDNFKLIK